MQNFSKLLVTLCLTSYSIQTHAQTAEPAQTPAPVLQTIEQEATTTPTSPAVIPQNKNNTVFGSIGYSGYSINNSSSSPDGFNVNITFLKAVAPLNEKIDFIAGPSLKYEQVKSSKTASNPFFTLNETLTFSTLQVGAEAGIKAKLFSSFNLYETLGYSYGIYNSLSTKITNGDPLIPDQTATANVHNSWNAGLNTRGLYSVNPIFSLGAGLYVGYGTYQYDSGTVQTAAGNINTNSGSEYFINTNLNLIAALSF